MNLVPMHYWSKNRSSAFGWRAVTALFGALMVLFVSGPVLAQTVALSGEIRRGDEREAGLAEDTIGYSDCVRNEQLEAPLTLSQTQGYTLQVWAGLSSECDDNDQRDQQVTNRRCWLVWSGDPTNLVTLPVRSILQPVEGETTTADRCEQEEEGSLTLFFLPFEGSNAVGTGAEVAFKYDLKGPRAPNLTGIGVGEETLYPKWDVESTTDIIGYRVYCEAAGPYTGGASSTGGSSSTAGAGGTSGAATAGAGGTSGAATAGADGIEAGVGGTSGNGGASNAGSGNASANGGAEEEPDDGCTAPTLRPGVRPPAALERGATSATSDTAEATGLRNGVTYACGVAGYDDLDNVGVLSNLRCGRPVPVLDYYEAYRRAGGNAGGGFCAFGRNSAADTGFILAAAALLLGLRRGRNARSAR
ncbi:MAG TPA: hypothetical protein VIM73_22930 [Polyangiaceae bacterium]